MFACLDALQGHSMVLMTSPDMESKIKAAYEEMAQVSEDTEFLQINNAGVPHLRRHSRKLLAEKEEEEWQDAPINDGTSWADYQDTNIDSDDNYWFLLFGGVSERGQVTSASGGNSYLY